MSSKPAHMQNTMVVTNDPEDRKGRLKRLGGSHSDHWNNVLANQTANALWLQAAAYVLASGNTVRPPRH
jgi:hypothetical protein